MNTWRENFKVKLEVLSSSQKIPQQQKNSQIQWFWECNLQQLKTTWKGSIHFENKSTVDNEA